MLHNLCRDAFFSLCLAILALTPLRLGAQTGTATLSGSVTDKSGAVVAGVQVTITNEDTGITFKQRTNGSGIYNASGIPPGRYSILIDKQGFARVLSHDVTLNVSDTVKRDFALQIGNASATVQVDGDEININTTNATVGTVIDRRFIEEIPLNGRSFQSLILLSPGVVTTTPQENTGAGEFSVNGQRGSDNSFTMDGASANNGSTSAAISGPTYSTAMSAGMTGSSTSLGTTQSVTSVDALQEFRINTSTYSAEYGRQPGAQVVFRTRSGTNEYHGTAFDYLRNGAFDANNWFNDYNTPIVQKPAERQNDFGGVLGGPISVPKLFSGKDRAFFFLSYEALRLTLPQAASVYYVPSDGTFNTGTYANPLYKNLRANAPATVQPLLNAFPLPNCTVAQNPQCIDYGDGLSPYVQTPPSGPGDINSLSARVDYQIASGQRLFARYADTTSAISSYDTIGPSKFSLVNRTRVYLIGLDDLIHGSLASELRLQYSPVYGVGADYPAAIGGAVPANLWTLQGIPTGGESVVYLTFPSGESSRFYGQNMGGRQNQPNAVETLSWTHGPHFFKTGADYRQTTAYFADSYLSRSPLVNYTFKSAASILTNVVSTATSSNFLRQDVTSKNLGAFFQDEWRILSRLSLSLGLRWDFNPAPTVSGAQQYTYTGSLSNPSSLALSALGARPYNSVYTDFAPRFGMALTIHNQAGHELVLRFGSGLYYTTGQELNYLWGTGNGLGTVSKLSATNTQPFPFAASGILAPPNLHPTAPYALGYVADPNLVPPSSIQWNVSLEQAIGSKQSFIIGYVGNEGRNLVANVEYSGTLNKNFSTFYQIQNGPGSSYDSLQLQYKRQAFRGLQVLGSYTWAHAIDSRSAATVYAAYGPLQRGNSDNDVRNNFSGALAYQVPSDYAARWRRTLFANWGLNTIVLARSGFPITLNGANVLDPVTLEEYLATVNWNGLNPYVYKKGIPGGRALNPANFSIPTTAQAGLGNAPRNFLRGFGMREVDLSAQRTFPIHDQIQLLFRAEAFNLPNHPNFGRVNPTCGPTAAGATCTNLLLGQAVSTLSNSLNGGSLNSLYQQGGPRSLQLALKLQF